MNKWMNRWMDTGITQWMNKQMQVSIHSEELMHSQTNAWVNEGFKV